MIITIAFLAVVVGGWMLFQQKDSGASLSVEEVAKLVKSDSSVVILDVRTESEYQSATGRLRNSVLIPIQELSQRLDELEQFRNQSIVVYCRTDNRSRRAASILREAGYNVRFMVGGIVRWNEQGLPVERSSE